MMAPGCRDIISEGDWEIKNPEKYKFDYKKIGPHSFGPTLTVGDNGIMLSVQLHSTDTGIINVTGQDLQAEFVSGNKKLKQLDAPGNGALMKILDMPFAVWYFKPPRKGKDVSSFNLTYKGDMATWNFTDGRKL